MGRLVRSGRTVVAVAETPVFLEDSQMFAAEIIVIPLPTNLQIIWVGGPETSATPGAETGCPLEVVKKEMLPFREFARVSLRDIFIDSIAAGEGVTWKVLV